MSLMDARVIGGYDMIVDRYGSWYIFVFSKDYLDAPKERCYIAYKGKQLTNEEFLEHWGKWIFYGEREELDKLAEKLDPYVENHQIPCIKYDRTPQKWFNMEQCVMCVYCDDRQRDEILEILSGFGVETKAWSYDREVIQKWLPGGLHMEQWIKSCKLSEENAEKLREESRQKYQKQFFDRPDDLCFGWEQ
jgi:hypothetical protein